MLNLPKIMVAPNGARRTQADHPKLPVTIDETVETCIACAGEGATGAHLHVRDDAGIHSLDADRYARLLEKIDTALPDFFAQITSESAGLYTAADQRDLIHALKPRSISVALREFLPDTATQSAAKDCYHWAHENGVTIQHICYSRDELDRLLGFMNDGIIPGTHHHVQLVLGSYDGTKISRPEDIASFAAPLITPTGGASFDWMMCAFGTAETDCLLRTFELGGKARIGFENSLWNADGSGAKNNAERVRELVSRMTAN
ncbi:3-keto-5-aminohexanoate cleavage protein [Yoonia sp. I 8.24]|uniref:3-keto-5-aminohexanoate cleavage protein n=1 Tax=Yoonia sp. I 8.24 TaxID=1537229 RepID=UPI001EDCAA78|nr:3-keto-5-aminohexanoate cleavage protein [Yoonia sp. I 8.24]MCG3268078.1 3-keto-5-aminohexanoate cleavage protein [Yoonia sp. I 8.24]